MDLRTEILAKRSKTVMEALAAWVGNSKSRFAQFMEMFLYDEDLVVVERSAWLLSFITDAHINLALPYLEELMRKMVEPGVHVGVKRAICRLFQFVDNIPEELEGELMITAFEWLADPNEAIAVRSCCMTILDNLSKKYPDIRQELVAIIEDQLQHNPTPAFRGRAKQVLARK
jgi:hypothetical protein